MDRKISQRSLKIRSGRKAEPNQFSTVTIHLKNKDFKWLKEDMGFFELPENWDLGFREDHQKPDTYKCPAVCGGDLTIIRK